MIVITRPLQDALRDAEELERAGFEALVEPMLSIEPLGFTVPDLEPFQAILITSSNGVRLFAAETEEREIPLYVVGKGTAAEAEAREFKYVLDANGNADDLVVLVQKSIKDKSQPVLYVRGEEVSVSITEMLADDGLSVEELVVYKANQIQNFSVNFIPALEKSQIQAISFYSKRTAENFVRLIEQEQKQDSLAAIKALCISPPVLKCVQSYEWKETYTAPAMNKDGMMALIRETCEPSQHIQIIKDKKIMSKKKTKQEAIQNAEEVIERFGGIRPMAKKIDVAVTTVQGWKKRNTIPGNRREEVLKAAASHNVDLSDIIQGALESQPPQEDSAPANENQIGEEKVAEVKRPKVAVSGSVPRAEKPGMRTSASEIEARLAASEKKAITTSTWINLFLIVLTIGAVAVLFWPSSPGGRLDALEDDMHGLRSDVDAVKAEQSFLSTLIPEDLDQRLADLQQRAGEAKESLDVAIEVAREVSSDVMAEETLEGRAVKLGEHVADLSNSQTVATLIEEFKLLSQTLTGQGQLEQAVADLSAIMNGTEPNADTAALNEAIDLARVDSPALNETLGGVPKQDLKAAALLLGMAQFRQSLNRNNQPFEEDLVLLQRLVGEDNPELTAALERLAPRAAQGVLTPNGLSNQFKGLAGDIVVSSLKGEDISLQDKASARFNDVLQIEKDGELITGTPTQATVAKAQSLLDAGDIQGAMTELQALQGEQAEIAAPWMEEAQATLLATYLNSFMGEGLEEAAESEENFETTTGRLIQNKELGINILKPRPKFSPSFGN